MISKIKNILDNSNADGYKIIETKTESEELFLIKKKVDMSRSKNVQHFKVTVYKDFEENGKKYKGSSSFDIHPTMTEAEIKNCIDGGIYAAGFVKNEYYEINKSENAKFENVKSNFSTMELSKWMPKIVEALYVNDTEENGGINSAEIFLNKNFKRIVTSLGEDVSYENYDGLIDFITTWKETEEIELYKDFTFSEFNAEFIADSVKDMIQLAKERAMAKDTIPSGKYKVILTGLPVRRVLSYYVSKSNTSTVYNKLSTFKVGESVQGDNIKGDYINLTLDPTLSNSVFSVPVDDDGVILSKVQIIENGKLKSYHGDLRHSYYLNTNVTGDIRNVVISGGSKSIAEMKKEPYVELVAFSDFQMDSITGDFGGEIRLGWYFDGTKTIPITGGSLSGNIKQVNSNMYLSKELQKDGGFFGPKSLEMFELTIAGK